MSNKIIHSKFYIIHYLLVASLVFICTKSFSQENDTFPYELKLKKDAIICGGGLLVASVGKLIPLQTQNNSIDYFDKLNKKDIIKFDRWAANNWNTSSNNLRDNLRWGALLGSLTLLPAVSAIKKKNIAIKNRLKNAVTIGIMGVEGFSYIFGLTMMSKKLITRNRPYAYNNKVSYTEKMTKTEYKESFFSGTTATTAFAVFFSAKVINDLCPISNWRYAGWGAAILYTSYVGYLAIDAGHHFPTDVLAGALIGGAIGYTIPWLHQKKHENMFFTLNPTIQQTGFYFSMTF